MIAKAEPRRWIEALPPDTLFASSEVPGRRSTVFSTLSRMAADPNRSGVERVYQGLYFKREWTHLGISSHIGAQARAAFWIAGGGSGLAHYFALNGLGWCNQIPVRYFVASASAQAPNTPTLEGVVWVPRSLPHRRAMTWAEVTLIEATNWWLPFGEWDWDDVLVELAEQNSFRQLSGWLKFGRPIVRPDVIRAAIPFEVPNECESHLVELEGHDLPDPVLADRLDHVASAVATRYMP